MSRKARVLESGMCEVTQEYKEGHGGIDIVREGYNLDNIVAHSDGTVVSVINNCNVNTPEDATKRSEDILLLIWVLILVIPPNG